MRISRCRLAGQCRPAREGVENMIILRRASRKGNAQQLPSDNRTSGDVPIAGLKLLKRGMYFEAGNTAEPAFGENLNRENRRVFELFQTGRGRRRKVWRW